MRDTDKDWTTIAETDPYWGVLSVEDFRGEELSDGARQTFFDSGKAFVENTFAFIRRHIDAGFAPARSLDFGCGVGRLLIPIAAHKLPQFLLPSSAGTRCISTNASRIT